VADYQDCSPPLWRRTEPLLKQVASTQGEKESPSALSWPGADIHCITSRKVDCANKSEPHTSANAVTIYLKMSL
jgi:hypothetical protein